MPLAEKRRRADFVLDGTQSLARLRRQTARLYAQLRSKV
jgi:dephospho-CoA kinase